MSPAPAPDRRAVWRDLAERRLPEAARRRPDWPVRLDHCFARILLDHACGGPWREHVKPPAHANMPADRLEAAIALGEKVLAGEADLDALNQRSLAWRGKLRGSSADAARQSNPRPDRVRSNSGEQPMSQASSRNEGEGGPADASGHPA